MGNLTIGFIGYGEAAYLISKGLKANNTIDIFAFDIGSTHEVAGKVIYSRAEEVGVTIVDSISELVKKSSVILSATSAKFAKSIAMDALNDLSAEQIYIDINATSGIIQEEIAKEFEGKALYVDAAVVESIPKYQHQVPTLICGSGAEEYKLIADKLGMNITYLGRESGSASATKMIRSIFMKGFTSLLLETLSAADQYNVQDEILSSLEQSIQKDTLKNIATMLITRTATHAERRVAEMDEVILTLSEMKVDSTMSQATKAKLEYLLDLNVKEEFLYEDPNTYQEVLDVIKKRGSKK